MKPSLMPRVRRKLAMIRLTPNATEKAVKALATKRPWRYFTATVKTVIHAPRGSCSIVPGTGPINLGQVQNLISRAEHGCIVRDDEQGLAFLPADGQKGGQHLPRGVGIEAGTWLIRQDHRGIIGQGACNRHSLLLTPRQVLRLVGETRTQAKSGEELP